ncbi:hypothetical protein AAY80_050 [Stenotrophomonas phage vB_SmaS-DLP_6]|nr:hypothetical protein AAY80_050 [Stenotrophomonas phage vB_SmaS-DLP_6]
MSQEQPVKYILPHGWVVQLKLDPDTYKTKVTFRHKDATRCCSGDIKIDDMLKGVEFDVDAAFDVALGNREAAFNGRRLTEIPKKKD